jgi:hypothetical protein
MKTIEGVVDDLLRQLKESEFQSSTSATGEWDWINNKYRNEYVWALYNRQWDDLRTFLLDPLSSRTAYGMITPVDSSNEVSSFNNDFLKDLELFQSNNSIKALRHEYLLIHPWSKDTEAYFTYPDSPRHAHFALRIIQTLKKITGQKIGLEIGGGYGGLIFFLRKFGFDGKLINCDLLETLLVSYVFLRLNGLSVRLCLSQKDLVEALKDEDQEQVILITTDLFKYIGEKDRISFVFNSRSFSEMSRPTLTTYLKSINQIMRPSIIFSENAEEILFPNSERHLEITQQELTSVLSSYELTDKIKTEFMGGANRYTLRILNRLN